MRKMILASVLAISTLSGCAGLSERDQRIGSGAVIGGFAGNLLGGGSAGATLGGAAIGGLLGSEVDHNRNDERYRDHARRYDDCRRSYDRRDCDGRRY
jgi:osmotically inducible lipoprotein OsmB